MKKITLIVFALIAFCWQSNAQASYYPFSETTGNTFSSISSTGTALPLTDDSKALVDLGFTVPYSLVDYTQVSVSSNGYMRMGDVDASNAFNTMASGGIYLNLIGPFWEDLNPSDGGAIYYQTDGVAPTRTFTLEYNAVPRYNGAATVTAQTVLYEGSGNIEFKYGTSSIGFDSASIGITISPGGSDNYISVSPGEPATSSSTTPNDAITEPPLDGVNYLFTYTPPSCLPPVDIVISGITETSAVANWTDAAGATLGNDFEFGLAGFTPGTGTAIAGNTGAFGTANAGDVLTPETGYDFYVRSNCDAVGTSVWVGPVSFSTSCSATSVPFMEDFETGGACGLIVNEGSCNVWEVIASESYQFTPNHLRYSWNSQNPANTWFFTQGINLVAGQSYDLGYEYGATPTSFPENLMVAYGTSPDATSMTTMLADHPGIVGEDVNVGAEIFTAPADGVYYIGFQAYSTADQFRLHLDNITLREDATLSINDAENEAAFTYFPNPVKNTLTLNAQNTIEDITMYNMLGQVVLKATPNTIASDLDMSSLQTGTYFVQVTIANETKMVRVMKQ
jgi:hypothetical protein